MDHDFEHDLNISRATEEALEQAKATLGEFFTHFAIVVQYDDGSVLHDSDNMLVEKALYLEALDMIKEEKRSESVDYELEWDDEDDDENYLVEDED